MKDNFKAYNFDRPKKRRNDVTASTKSSVHVLKKRLCHCCKQPVKYNYAIGGYNYKIGNFVFCSWKCIQEYRRKYDLLPKEIV